MDVSLWFCAVCPCVWPSTCTLCVCSNSFCFPHCIPHPQQPPPLLLNLVPHVHSPALCLTSWHLPYSPCTASALASPHLSLLTFFSPVWVSRTETLLPNLLCSRVPGEECCSYPQWDMERENLSSSRKKEMLFCASAPSCLLSSFCCIPQGGWVNYAAANVQAPTMRRFLYCFHTKSLCKGDFGCTCTDAVQLNDKHEVCRWWSQSYNRKIS